VRTGRAGQAHTDLLVPSTIHIWVTTASERREEVSSYDQTPRGSASSRREDGEMNNAKEPQML